MRMRGRSGAACTTGSSGWAFIRHEPNAREEVLHTTAGIEAECDGCKRDDRTSYRSAFRDEQEAEEAD